MIQKINAVRLEFLSVGWFQNFESFHLQVLEWSSKYALYVFCII
jgi:hypothetical protein